MLGIVDPAADYTWNSVATIVTKEGVDEKMPRTDEDWQMVRHNAITARRGHEPAAHGRPAHRQASA